MNAEDVAAEFERLAADCTMPSFAERRLVKARAIRALLAERDEAKRNIAKMVLNAMAVETRLAQIDKKLSLAISVVTAERDALRDALENLIIGIGMGWDLEGIIEEAQKLLDRKP